VSDAKPTEHHSLAVVAKEIPKGVICLLSALRFHELTTQQPSEVWIGVPVRSLEGVPVRIFTAARTVADCFKYRNKIGLDVAIEALKDALKRKKVTIGEIER